MQKTPQIGYPLKKDSKDADDNRILFKRVHNIYKT